MQKRVDYLDYVAATPRPSVVVIEDKGEPPGYDAFWGEVQTNVQGTGLPRHRDQRLDPRHRGGRPKLSRSLVSAELTSTLAFSPPHADCRERGIPDFARSQNY